IPNAAPLHSPARCRRVVHPAGYLDRTRITIAIVVWRSGCRGAAQFAARTFSTSWQPSASPSSVLQLSQAAAVSPPASRGGRLEYFFAGAFSWSRNLTKFLSRLSRCFRPWVLVRSWVRYGAGGRSGTEPLDKANLM